MDSRKINKGSWRTFLKTYLRFMYSSLKLGSSASLFIFSSHGVVPRMQGKSKLKTGLIRIKVCLNDGGKEGKVKAGGRGVGGRCTGSKQVRK